MTQTIQDIAIEKLSKLTNKLSLCQKTIESDKDKKEYFFQIAREGKQLASDIESGKEIVLMDIEEQLCHPFSEFLLDTILPIREAEDKGQSDPEIRSILVEQINHFVHDVECDARLLNISSTEVCLKKHQQDIQYIESKLAAIVTHCDDAIIGKDLDGVIHTWNKGAENLFGYRFSEILGKKVSVLMPPEAKEDMKQILDTIARGQKVSHYETVRVRKDGTKVPVLVTVSPIKASNGCIEGGSTIVKNLTERKKLEDQLQKFNDELEQKIAERTNSLVEANKELENFAKIAAHDLKEPLATIKGCTRLISAKVSSLLNNDDMRVLDFLLEASDRMMNLVDDLLTHASMSEAIDKFEICNCDEILASVQTDLAKQISESKTTIILKGEPLPTVMGNKRELHTVFQNLINNAIKYRSHRDPRIVVTVEDKIGSATSDEWWISFEDNGIGMKTEYRQNIFKMFARLHSQAEYPGTGIGLAICKKVIRAHGGKIWVESREGTGSKFFISLPHIE